MEAPLQLSYGAQDHLPCSVMAPGPHRPSTAHKCANNNDDICLSLFEDRVVSHPCKTHGRVKKKNGSTGKWVLVWMYSIGEYALMQCYCICTALNMVWCIAIVRMCTALYMHWCSAIVCVLHCMYGLMQCYCICTALYMHWSSAIVFVLHCICTDAVLLYLYCIVYGLMQCYCMCTALYIWTDAVLLYL